MVLAAKKANEEREAVIVNAGKMRKRADLIVQTAEVTTKFENEEKNYKLVTDDYYKAFAIFNNRFHSAMRCIESIYCPIYF